MKNNELERKLLTILSTDARVTNEEISAETGIPKDEVSNVIKSLENKYKLAYAPEINLNELWHMEFAREARMQTKRGIIGEAKELISSTGFEEYEINIKFIDRMPNDEAVKEALGKSYYVQYVGKSRGKYDFWVYAVARSKEDIAYMLNKTSKEFSGFEFITNVKDIKTVHGFFPLNEQLIQDFKMFDSYKNLLIGLVRNGRMPFVDIGKQYNQGATQMVYAYDRLLRTGVLKRVTAYEKAPAYGKYAIAEISVTNPSRFEESKEKWFEEIIKRSESGSCIYVFIAETLVPLGYEAIIAAKEEKELNKELAFINKLPWAKLESSRLSRSIIGDLAVRELDMRYSEIYEYLESRNKVPTFSPKQREAKASRELYANLG